MIDTTVAEVLVRCERQPPITRVLLTVVSRTDDPELQLRRLSLQFCGNVTGSDTAAGWKVQIERERGRESVEADVGWDLLSQSSRAVPAGGRLGGFEVSLRGDWHRMGYWLGSTGVGTGQLPSPHDCRNGYRRADDGTK
jgi:hypothetical protein